MNSIINIEDRLHIVKQLFELQIKVDAQFDTILLSTEHQKWGQNDFRAECIGANLNDLKQLKTLKNILSLSDDNLNLEIKKACKMVGFDSIETRTRTIGGKKVTTQYHKYELVSSHTCRRSFCTNMYLRDMDILMIMSISAHQHAERMAKKWSEIYK